MRTTLLAFLLLAACGPAETEDVAGGLAGSWVGTTRADVDDATATTKQASLVVSGSPGGLKLTGVCPDGSGEVVVEGLGATKAWKGVVSCPAAEWGSCPSTTMTYYTGCVEQVGEELKVRFCGEGDGCGGVLGSWRFTGTKAP